MYSNKQCTSTHTLSLSAPHHTRRCVTRGPHSLEGSLHVAYTCGLPVAALVTEHLAPRLKLRVLADHALTCAAPHNGRITQPREVAHSLTHTLTSRAKPLACSKVSVMLATTARPPQIRTCDTAAARKNTQWAGPDQTHKQPEMLCPPLTSQQS